MEHNADQLGGLSVSEQLEGDRRLQHAGQPRCPCDQTQQTLLHYGGIYTIEETLA